MKRFRLEDFSGGWFVGDFEPSVMRTGECEIAVKSLSRNSAEPAHYQMEATEITLVISGACRLGNQRLETGDLLVIGPNEVADFEALTDVVLVAVKVPSLPTDKVEVLTRE